ncbi:abortive infection family protein [bacterium]|nr:abortive infection family protein [bacterium]
MNLISKRTRREFQEYFVGTTLREIELHFDNYDIPQTQLPEGKLPSGQRRGLVEEYYVSIDWTNPKDIKKVLSVYADVLIYLNEEGVWNVDYRKKWFEKLIRTLKRDGYEFNGTLIVPIGQVEYQQLETATNLLDRTHFQEYIERIKISIDTDPSLAIGSAKELVESTLKTILTELGIRYNKNDYVPKLLKETQKVLDLAPADIDDAKKGVDVIKVLLSNLGQVAIKTAELRNLYGTGHGKEKRKGLNSRHARLAVGAAITLCTFLLETFELKTK